MYHNYYYYGPVYKHQPEQIAIVGFERLSQLVHVPGFDPHNDDDTF